MSSTQALDPKSEAPAPASTKPKKGVLQFEITKKKVPRKDLMHFSRQLGVFVRAGISILDALEAILEEMDNKLFRSVVTDIIARLRSGSTFSEAASVHKDVFPPYYLGILRSAELTGRLDTVLDQLSEYIERDLEARRKVTSALAYPGVILATALVVVVVLTTFVLPRFEKFFASLGAKLPLATRALLGVASFVTGAALFIAAGLLLLATTIWLALRTEQGRYARDRIALRLPVIGDLVQHAVLERFCRILSAMMTAGVPLPEALAVTTEATNNRVYQRGLTAAREAMIRGEGLAGPLVATGLFPPSAKQMFRVGEATGSLDQQLETAATYFDRELDYKIKNFTTLIEPAVLVFVGLVVGFVAIALVSAMYGAFGQTKAI